MVPELQCWGGVECTVNRVGNRWFDQLERSGHAQRDADLDLVAGLGIRTLRYPLLWERAAPLDPQCIDWRWGDARLGRLRDLGIEPVAGLVHHGSGPAYTDLLDPQFAPGLARYAGAVAARYPWLRYFTPVNEPLTTARFSGLYGHWYPHCRSDHAFVRILLNQCRAVVLAMRAIRRVIPEALLIQTDDLGTTYSTPRMLPQADFDNERRWLGWDLIGGRVDAAHPLRAFLLACGATAEELDSYVAAPCPPDFIGINHYVTSDRFLDAELSRYPPHTHGGNGRERYADVEAVRVMPEYRPWQVLTQAWQRYHIPIVITEAHLGCTREEQVRWLHDAWQSAGEARAEGCDVRAVTVWSLFGSYDWDSLLTRERGNYEPGAFDVRAPVPHPTALAGAVRELCSGHAALPDWGRQGWWSRPERLAHGFGLNADDVEMSGPGWNSTRPRPLVICGEGTLARALASACALRAIPHRVVSRRDMEASNPQAVALVLDDLRPWAVINAAGFVRVDDAESEPDACFRDNLDAAKVLAEATARRGLPLLTFSSDLVFDGDTREPYVESSRVNPLNVYGRSKAAAEKATLELNDRTLCVRTAAFFGYWHPSDFLWRAVSTLSEGRAFEAIGDASVSPTYVPDLAQVSLDLLLDGATGIWHLCNAGAITWAEFARAGARCTGVDAGGVHDIPLRDFRLPAARPSFAALASERAHLMPSLDCALDRFAELAQRRGVGETALALP